MSTILIKNVEIISEKIINAIPNSLKYAVNGAILLGTGFIYPGIPVFSDTVAFYTSGRNLVLHRKGFTGFNANIPQQTLTFLIYGGNYDL